MGTIISGNDIEQTLNAVNSIKKDGQVVQQVQQNGLTGELQGIMEFASAVNGILDKVMLIRGKVAPPQPPPQQIGMSIPPTQIQSHKGDVPPPPQQTIEQPVQEVNTMNKELDQNKVEAVVRDLLIVQATNLPKYVKDAKVGEITGENFPTYKWNFKGIPIGADLIVGEIAKKLMEVIPKLYKE